MKYFVDATIVDKTWENPTQKVNYEVNTNNVNVTLESVKAEILGKIKVPEKYRLANEKLVVGGKDRELTFAVSEARTIFYTANFELIPLIKNEK